MLVFSFIFKENIFEECFKCHWDIYESRLSFSQCLSPFSHIAFIFIINISSITLSYELFCWVAFSSYFQHEHILHAHDERYKRHTFTVSHCHVNIYIFSLNEQESIYKIALYIFENMKLSHYIQLFIIDEEHNTLSLERAFSFITLWDTRFISYEIIHESFERYASHVRVITVICFHLYYTKYIYNTAWERGHYT